MARGHDGGRPPTRPELCHQDVSAAPQGPGGELPLSPSMGCGTAAVSLMLASGADIAVVSKLMRHASIAITADVYSLWSVPSLRKPWTVPRT